MRLPSRSANQATNSAALRDHAAPRELSGRLRGDIHAISEQVSAFALDYVAEVNPDPEQDMYENFILTGQISQNNFFGWGQTLSLQVQWSSVRQLGQIQFVEPYFLDTKWTFAFDLYATEGVYTTFTRRAVGGSMTWGYELTGLSPWWSFARRLEDMRLFATYTNERVRRDPRRPGRDCANRFKSGTTSAVRLSLQWDGATTGSSRPRLLHLRRAEVGAAVPRAGVGVRRGEPVHPLRGRRALVPADLRASSRAASWRSATSATGTPRTGSPSPSSTTWAASTRSAATATSPSPPRARARRLGPTRPRRRSTVGGDKQVVLNLELEFPLLREGGRARRGLRRRRKRLRPRRITRDPNVPLALQVGGVRLPLVQPHRPAPLRVGRPARPPHGTRPRARTSTSPSTSSSRSATSSTTTEGPTMTNPRDLAPLAAVLAAPAAARARREVRLRGPPARPHRDRRGQGRQRRAQAGLRREAEAARRASGRVRQAAGRSSRSRPW